MRAVAVAATGRAPAVSASAAPCWLRVLCPSDGGRACRIVSLARPAQLRSNELSNALAIATRSAAASDARIIGALAGATPAATCPLLRPSPQIATADGSLCRRRSWSRSAARESEPPTSPGPEAHQPLRTCGVHAKSTLRGSGSECGAPCRSRPQKPPQPSTNTASCSEALRPGGAHAALNSSRARAPAQGSG